MFVSERRSVWFIIWQEEAYLSLAATEFCG
jgi:hypothetical protein